MENPLNSRNKKRASYARKAYKAAKPKRDIQNEPDQDLFNDMLSDLRHFAAAAGLDFEKAERVSENNFRAEHTG